MMNKQLSTKAKMAQLAPMIVNSAKNNFGKYDVAETYM
jgi:hypothetical protein